MRRFLLTVIIIISSALVSKANRPLGFWGIPFGSSIAEVDTLMLQKEEVKCLKGGSLYKGGVFSGLSVDKLSYYYVDDRMYKAEIILLPKTEKAIFKVYASLKAKFNQKYFPPSACVEQFYYPYRKGDLDEISALKVGKVTYMSHWIFDTKVDIILTITDQCVLRLVYTDKNLDSIFQGRQLTKELNDL